MTPKMRLRPSASRASTPPSSTPLSTASSRKISNVLHPHIGFADQLVVPELGGGSGEVDGAGLEQIGPVDAIEDLTDVLLDDQHREAFVANAADEIEDLLDHERGESGGRLVHEQQLRARHQ